MMMDVKQFCQVLDEGGNEGGCAPDSDPDCAGEAGMDCGGDGREATLGRGGFVEDARPEGASFRGAGVRVGDCEARDYGATELVRRLSEGMVKAEELGVEVRRGCVGELTENGFTAGEIAELMGVSERTVTRDRTALRQAGAMPPSLSLGDELLGEYHRLTLGSVQRLRRLAQDREAGAYARLWAEGEAGRIYHRFIETVRQMGYLEEGGGRLEHLRATDAEAIERDKQMRERRVERSAEKMKEMRGLMGQVLGGGGFDV